MLETTLVEELNQLDKSLIIPLGKNAQKGLLYALHLSKLDEAQVLFNFPHPSGANGHRIKQFKERKNDLKSNLLRWHERYT